MDGIPVSLYDTAGLREAENPVEQEGIRRSSDVVAAAHIVLYVIDGEAGAAADELKAINTGAKDTIFVWNKTDIAENTPPGGVIPVSAVTGEGFSLLEEEILKKVGGEINVSSGAAVIDSGRQKDLLSGAKEALVHVEEGLASGASLDGVAVDLKEALDCLGEITGEVTSADILDTMFSSFCVGK